MSELEYSKLPNDSYLPCDHRTVHDQSEIVRKEHIGYVLYRVGARKIKLAADFLYVDHSSVANPGDPEPEWARDDAAAFPDYIAGRELYGNNSYAQIRGGELAALNIEWVP